MIIDEIKIIGALESIRNSIAQYVEIMNMFSIVNVASDKYFQKKFNGYYRIRQRNEKWYQAYYNYMENQKDLEVSFSAVLRYMQKNAGRYEPSFSSKFLATHNPNMPIWDTQVLISLNMKPPNYYSKNKYIEAEALYENILAWYADHIDSYIGKYIISNFNEIYPDYKQLSDVKKIDFVLWYLGT